MISPPSCRRWWAWPCPVDEVDLVGHSMGGLVIRSACHYGRHHATIADRLRRRPLARQGAAGRAARRAQRRATRGGRQPHEPRPVVAPIPATRLIGLGLDRRSEGIKDLRWGSVLDEDWVERDPGAPSVPGATRPRSRHADYLLIAARSRSARRRPPADGQPDPRRRLVTAPSARRARRGRAGAPPDGDGAPLPGGEPRGARQPPRGLRGDRLVVAAVDAAGG